MFSFKNPKYDPTRFDSLLCSGITVNGDVEFTGSLKVDGVIMGSVTPKDLEKTTAITVKGVINAEIVTADFVIVEEGGVINAKQVTANSQVIVKKGGVINAPISYRQISLEAGSTVAGTLQPIIDAKAVPSASAE